jgi:hypothetical protein
VIVEHAGDLEQVLRKRLVPVLMAHIDLYVGGMGFLTAAATLRARHGMSASATMAAPAMVHLLLLLFLVAGFFALVVALALAAFSVTAFFAGAAWVVLGFAGGRADRAWGPGRTWGTGFVVLADGGAHMAAAQAEAGASGNGKRGTGADG